MAAREPYRVSDLVAKYGWKIMVYLSNLGATVLTEAQVLFVDSNHTNATDADDTEHGHSFEKPLATINFAIGLCTAGEQSIIIAAPGHNEPLANAQIDFDVVGVHLIGVGEGSLKPRVDFDHANSSVNIGANNVSIQNIDLLPAINSVLIGVHVETDVTDFKMKDVRFLIGEDGSGVDEFIKAVEMTSGNDDCVFEDVIILAHASSAEATHGIHVAAAADRTIWRNVIIDGPYATGGIVEAAAGENLIVEDCAVDVSGTNYAFDGSSTFAKRVNNVDGQVLEDDSESLLVEDRGSAAYPSGITDESVWAYLLSKSSTPAASSYDNEEDSLEAISDKVDAIGSPTDVTGAVPDTPTAKSLQDILSKLDGANTFDNTTDSLEAIADLLLTGRPLTGLQLDHLCAYTTGVAADDDLETFAVAGSLMAHICSVGADITTFKPTTDSLEAIGTAVAALSFDAAVSQTPTARSMQDILEKDNSGSFNDATDSLEAIRDHIDGTTVLGGIQLDHLAQTVSAGTNYPTEITTDSILGMVISANGNPSGFNKTTDSLEAIRNRMDALNVADQVDLDAILLDTGTTIPGTITTMQGNVTDILADTLTISGGALPGTATSLSLQRFVAGGDTGLGTQLPASTSLYDVVKLISSLIDGGTNVYPDSVATDSQLAYLMVKADPAVISQFDNSTDSLEAIADSILTGATILSGVNLDHLAKVVCADTTDAVDMSTEIADDTILANILDDGGVVANYDRRTHSLVAIGDDTDAILADTTVMAERTVEKSDGAVLNGDDDIFDITGGPILVTNLVGVVTAGPVGGAANLSVIETSTDPGGDINLSTVVAIDNDAQGTSYAFTAAVPSVLTPTTAGTLGGIVNPGWLCPIGTIKAKGTAAQSGTIKWYLTYKPLSPSSAVVAAT
jgi:hypothetical protein